jgi:hypothetical protein
MHVGSVVERYRAVTKTGTTLQSRTSIEDLPLAATVLFRCRAVTKTGRGDWSQPVSFFTPWPAPKTA